MATITTREQKKINKHIRLFIDSQIASKDGNITLDTLRNHLQLNKMKATGKTYINERLYYLGYRSFTNVKREDWNKNVYFKKDTVLAFLEEERTIYPEYIDDITSLIEEFCIRSIKTYKFVGTNIYNTASSKFRYETHINLYDDIYLNCIMSKIETSEAYKNVLHSFTKDKTIFIWTKDAETAIELRNKLFSTLLNSLWYSYENGEKKLTTKIPFNLSYSSEVNTEYMSARERFLDFLVDLLPSS